MNYAGINYCDMANGPGIRVSLFVSGCRIHCKDCFNKEAWDFNYGKKFKAADADKIISALCKPEIAGLSILGGEPFEPEHEITLQALFMDIKDVWMIPKTIWVWTGHLYDQVKDSPLIPYIDVLVDGPFVQKKAEPNLKWRGSSNQRIIPLRKGTC